MVVCLGVVATSLASDTLMSADVASTLMRRLAELDQSYFEGRGPILETLGQLPRSDTGCTACRVCLGYAMALGMARRTG